MAMKKVQDDTSKDISNVLNEIEDEKMQKMNKEVETDEDGIVRDVPLLAGIPYKGDILKTFSYREMTGKDEEAINKTDVRANGAKFAITLVERCVFAFDGITKKEVGTEEWKNIVRKALSADLTFMLMKIRQLSLGDELEIEHKCPRCGTKLHTITSISEMEEDIIPFKGEFKIPFEMPRRGYKDLKGNFHKTGYLRLPNGEDVEIAVPKMLKNTASGTSLLLTRCIEFDDGIKQTEDGIAKMSTKDRQYLEKLFGDNTFGFKDSIEVTCVNCGETVDVYVGNNVVNFF